MKSRVSIGKIRDLIPIYGMNKYAQQINESLPLEDSEEKEFATKYTLLMIYNATTLIGSYVKALNGLENLLN